MSVLLVVYESSSCGSRLNGCLPGLNVGDSQVVSNFNPEGGGGQCDFEGPSWGRPGTPRHLPLVCYVVLKNPSSTTSRLCSFHHAT